MVALLKPPYPFYSHTDPLVSRADGLLYNTHTHTFRESIVLMNTLFKHSDLKDQAISDMYCIYPDKCTYWNE